jgi:hypothetical protein
MGDRCRRRTPARLVLSVALLAALVDGGCRSRGTEEGARPALPGRPAAGPAAQLEGAPDPSAPLPAAAPIAPAVAIPEGPAVAAPLLREPAGQAECAAACDRLVQLEARPWIDGTPEGQAREDVRAVIASLARREQPACVERCRKELSKAATACLMATEGVAAAVDCLARTGLVGPAAAE